MEIVDIAIMRQGNMFTAHTFSVCLSELNWHEVIKPFIVFNGMSKIGMNCPTISRGKHQCLKMIWDNEQYLVIVWFFPHATRIKYALVDRDQLDTDLTPVSCSIEEATTLFELWVAHLNQDEVHDECGA